MNDYFIYDPRLHIRIPALKKPWSMYSIQTQNDILSEWERIRGHIPDRIVEIEELINCKQEELNHEEEFHRSCELNEEISELASIINDLWIWFRTNQHITKSKMHA